jgi:hypothetical protein
MHGTSGPASTSSFGSFLAQLPFAFLCRPVLRRSARRTDIVGRTQAQAGAQAHAMCGGGRTGSGAGSGSGPMLETSRVTRPVRGHCHEHSVRSRRPSRGRPACRRGRSARSHRSFRWGRRWSVISPTHSNHMHTTVTAGPDASYGGSCGGDSVWRRCVELRTEELTSCVRARAVSESPNSLDPARVCSAPSVRRSESANRS